ncbi:hypothetical protein JCM33374_g1554 [Metschnikowia sp. JCM 33374]|nr:hypothetical protein JCM33374_g1554 [Metschnikowia sp. JCM 33374]
MENFLNDPYEDSQRQTAAHNRWDPASGQVSNLADLQFTVAPTSSGAADLHTNYATYTENTQQSMNQHSAKDPFLETFDFLGSPTQQGISPGLPADSNDPWTDVLGTDNFYGDGLGINDPLNNLDSLVLPENSNNNIRNGNGNGNGNGHGNLNGNINVNGNGGHNMFSSSQYFSPNTRGANFGQLNSIVEDSVSPSFYSNTFSPTESRHGSISIPPPSNSYLSHHTLLSPQTNALDGSFDTLRSPYSGSYLNSPPNISLSQSTGMNLTSSYATSPNNQSHGMGPSSVGAAPNNHLRKAAEQAATPKQLTSEEKAKRRREFHNAVERRRRDLIKEKIKVLGFLVPPSLLTPQVCAVQALSKQPNQNTKEMKDLISSVRIKDSKPNKAFILQTSVDYINHLHYVLERQDARRKELEDAINKLSLSSTPNDEPSTGPDVLEPFLKTGSSLSAADFDPNEFFSADI